MNGHPLLVEADARIGRHAVVRRRAIGGVSLTHDEATKAVKQMVKNSATLRTEQLEKGAEELRELKTSAALRRLWSSGRVKIAFDLDDEPLKFGAIEP